MSESVFITSGLALLAAGTLFAWFEKRTSYILLLVGIVCIGLGSPLLGSILNNVSVRPTRFQFLSPSKDLTETFGLREAAASTTSELTSHSLSGSSSGRRPLLEANALNEIVKEIFDYFSSIDFIAAPVGTTTVSVPGSIIRFQPYKAAILVASNAEAFGELKFETRAATLPEFINSQGSGSVLEFKCAAPQIHTASEFALENGFRPSFRKHLGRTQDQTLFVVIETISCEKPRIQLRTSDINLAGTSGTNIRSASAGQKRSSNKTQSSSANQLETSGSSLGAAPMQEGEASHRAVVAYRLLRISTDGS
jgi:hypothetical protein